jgi:hypothetical protein
MAPTELLAYCGGFFDGEGTVTITTQNSKAKSGRRSHRVQINASQKEISPLILLKHLFGGNIKMKTRRGLRCIYTWWVGGRDKQKRFLELILPYLIVKKAEAEIAKEFLETVSGERVRNDKGMIAKTTDSLYEFREGLYRKSLNVRRLKSLMQDRTGQYEFPISAPLLDGN